MLEESNLRNQSLSSEIALLQTEVETLESRFGEATEAGQKLDGARQELETSTRKYVAMEQALQQTEQERASNSTRTHQRRTTIPGVQC